MSDSPQQAETSYTVNDLAAWIEQNIDRRKKALDDDMDANVLLQDRVVSSAISLIPGVDNHLQNAKQAKYMYDNQYTADPMGHGTVTRGEMRKKYSLKE